LQDKALATTPVVLITASGEILTKPLDVEKLLAIAAKHCAVYRRWSMSLRAFVKIPSNIGSVSLPVNVFCWLGW